MKLTPSHLFIVLAPFILANCRSNKTGSDSVGSADFPFDEKGNYREDWVKAAEEGRPVVDLTKNNPTSVFVGTTDPRDAKVDPPPPPSRPTVTRTTRSKSTATKSHSHSKPVSKVAAKPKPKIAAKPKPKPKPPAPKFVTTTVKTGDTLYALSKRYGVSVQAIQKANGMGSSTALRDGRTIKIPK